MSSLTKRCLKKRCLKLLINKIKNVQQRLRRLATIRSYATLVELHYE